MPQTPTEPAPASETDAPKLERGLGELDATMIVIGSMIGSGIFLTSAEVARLVGAPGWLLLAWALAGLMTVAGALCVAEVAAMIPRAGGQYVFLREAYGPAVGFVFGWATFLVVQTGTIAAVAVAFTKFLEVFLPAVSASRYLVEPVALGQTGYALSLSTQQLVAIGVIATLTLGNTRGLRAGVLVQNSFTVTKTAALLGLIVVGLAFGRNPGAAAWTSSWFSAVDNGWKPPTIPGLEGVGGVLLLLMLGGKAMVGPLFSQTAWNSVTFTGGEVRDPGRTLPRALLVGCGSVVALYLLANVAYVVTLPLSGIADAPRDRVGTAVMHAVLGDLGTYLMAGAILISTFGCVNGLVLSGARVFYAMARDGLFFHKAGTVNAHHVPAFALAAQGVWAAILTLPVTVSAGADGKPTYGNLYNQLLEYIAPVDLAFYGLMVATLMVFRRTRPGADRPYRTFGYPVTPLLYVALAALLVLNFVATGWKTSGIGLLIALAGLPVYLVWSRVGRRPAAKVHG